jgi:thioredoxin 1
MGAAVAQVNDTSFQIEVEQSAVPTLVDFWAPWCGPCRALAPTIEEIAAQYAGRVKVVKLNTDESPDTATRLGIRSIPTTLLFKNGRVVEHVVGNMPKRTFIDMLEKHL